jgi:voltage-gated potassium channel Kch
MSEAVVAGPERGLADALADQGLSVRRFSGVISRERLLEAGIEEAALFVLTDVSEATAVPVALEANPDLRVVIYAPETMPEFVRGQVDLALDPAVLSAASVAQELIAGLGDSGKPDESSDAGDNDV